jgi:predicted MPP superfamily phosphohydrolase
MLQAGSPYLALPPKSALLISLLATVIIALYGYFEARSIQNNVITIESPKIPKEIDELTIAQISDVHLGLTVRHGRLKKILRAVKQAEPDILISTGDLVDGQICNLSGLAELLHSVEPKYGKFAITGNHEFYAGLDQALRFTEKAGFKILRGEALTVADAVNIVGIDDGTGRRTGAFKGGPEKDLLSSVPQDKFTLLLKHVPLVNKDATGLFDLQLSGHTHKGQIFPFNLIVKLLFPTDAGLVHLNNGSLLYINRGSGTWGPPIRFLSPPEVTIIKLIHKEQNSSSDLQ